MSAVPRLSHATSGQAEPPHAAMEQAAQWYALLRSEDAAGADREQWQSWLHSNADHRRAWSYVEAVSQNFAAIQATTDPRQTVDNLWAANVRVMQRRRVLTGIAALAGAGLLGWTAWHHTALPAIALAWTADHRTSTGEVREIVLSDDTRVWLNTASALDEDFSAGLRRLRLRAGEVLIDTAADPARPFVIDTTQGRLRALGTRFTVRLEGNETLLAVYEGAVEVRTAATGVTAVIPAGRQVRFTGSSVQALASADPAREAWSRGVLVAADIPLQQVVEELRRYRSGHLGVAPDIADLRVLGNFPLRDTDTALSMLASALPIQIRQTLPWWTSIEARATTKG